MSWPRNVTRPLSGRWKPVSRLKSVVLPAPFGPMRPVIVPSRTASEHRSTARTPPNDFVRSSAARKAAVARSGNDDEPVRVGHIGEQLAAGARHGHHVLVLQPEAHAGAGDEWRDAEHHPGF